MKNLRMKVYYLLSEKKSSINFNKIIFILSVFVLCINSLYAQNCDLERTNDDFNSGQTVYSKDVNLASVFPLVGSKKPWNLVMCFMLVDKSISISVTHQSQSYSSSISSINFRFKDGTILKKETPTATGEYNTGFGYEYKFTGFSLTKEELELFASKDLSKFQAYFSYFPDYPVVEENIKSINVKKIRKDASCILIEFNSESTIKEEKNSKVFEYNCGYEINEIDDFTKQRNVLTKSYPLYEIRDGGIHVFFQAAATNKNGFNGLHFSQCYSIEVDLKGAKINEEPLKDYMLFDQVDLLLANDEPVSFKTDVLSDYLFRGQVAWSYKTFPIEDYTIWQKLKTFPIKKFRLSKNGKELRTLDVENNFSNAIISVINCLDALGISKPE